MHLGMGSGLTQSEPNVLREPFYTTRFRHTFRDEQSQVDEHTLLVPTRLVSDNDPARSRRCRRRNAIATHKRAFVLCKNNGYKERHDALISRDCGNPKAATQSCYTWLSCQLQFQPRLRYCFRPRLRPRCCQLQVFSTTSNRRADDATAAQF